jgi:hypothetical protein
MTRGGSVARAKHTVRAEARRRYRQAANLPEDDTVAELDDSSTKAAARPAAPKPASQARPASAPTGRPSFLGAFRAAYRPAHLREDLRELPKLLTSRALLAGIGLVLAGAAAWIAFPNYTGSAFAWELLVYPGQALAPQLVAGFFAPRASYILGLIVGVVQGIVFAAYVMSGPTPVDADRVGALLTISFATGPFSGLLFASAAAWYRRFLSLSSRGRPQSGRQQGKAPVKPAPSRRSGR